MGYSRHLITIMVLLALDAKLRSPLEKSLAKAGKVSRHSNNDREIKSVASFRRYRLLHYFTSLRYITERSASNLTFMAIVSFTTSC